MSLLGALLPETVKAPLRRLRHRLERLRRRFDEARFRRYDVQRRYGGHLLRVHIADPTAQEWYDHDWDLPAEIALLQSRGRLARGARVFDVGAHQAVVALMLAEIVGSQGQVVAVEPAPHNVRVARRNAAANACSQMVVVPAAAGDETGTLWFLDNWNGSVSDRPGFGVQVEQLTVDCLTARFGAPDVLFVDVEGFELHVLRGAAQTLAAHQPDLFIEVHSGVGLQRFGTVDDLLALIPAPYEVWVASEEGGAFVPLATGRSALNRRSFLVAFAPRPTEITGHD